MTWHELYRRGIYVSSISQDSEAYQVMRSAAVKDKNPTARYYLGLWEEKVNNNPHVAKIWLRMAEKQNYRDATAEIKRIEREYESSSKRITKGQKERPSYSQTAVQEERPSYSQTADIAYDHVATNCQPTSLVIKEHNFQESKNALKRFAEQKREDVNLERVPNFTGFFGVRDYKVTGYDLNKLTSQIQDHIQSLNDLSMGLIGEFGEVYKAFESLDKDYISGIVASIKAAEEVSKQEQKDRKEIKRLVEQHEQSVAVLKKFKAEIDKLKHLTDVDKAWELIEKQSKLTKEYGDYIAELSKVKYLKDVDKIHTEFEKLKRDFSRVSDLQTKYLADLKSVREYCDVLSKLRHIKDVDKLWADVELVAKDVLYIEKLLEAQKQALFDFDVVIQRMQDAQQEFIDKADRLIAEFREDVSNQFALFTEEQTAQLNNMDHHYADSVEKLSVEQQEKLAAIEKSLSNTLDSAVQEQTSAINKIEKTQAEKFNELMAGQSATLEQIAGDQSSKLEEIYQSLEAEKTFLNEQVGTLARDVNNQFALFTETQTAKLSSMDCHYADAVEKLSVEQQEKLTSIEQSLGNTLESVVQEQTSAINKIEKTQAEKFNELMAGQSAALERIANDQLSKLEEINKSLEVEKAFLNEQVAALTQKVKLLSYVAGGAAAITVIQLLLNVLGVI